MSFTRRNFIMQSGLGAASILTKMSRAAAEKRGDQDALQKQLSADPQRPQYHFLPPANWMNDPNGPLFWKGSYHLFYQHNPNGAYWGDMHWGHARGKDLVHWEHLPMALAPTPRGPDKDGCFSGSAFVNDGVPTLVYTGVFPEVQCLATSDDTMIRWKKFEGNPVLDAPPADLQVTGFRDPAIWKEADSWLMTVGSGFKGRGGAVFLYGSKDLTHWTYLHTLLTASPFEEKTDAAQAVRYDAVATGDMWECPDFFPLAQKHCLLVSTQGRVYYFTGSYSHQKFQRESAGLVDGSDLYYAAKSFLGQGGRRILWGWLREARTEAAQRQAGWAGVMSLPRVLSLGSEDSLQIDPIPELRMLRGKHFEFGGSEVSSLLPIEEIRGGTLEIRLKAELRDARQVGLKVRQSPDAAEETTIAYDTATQNLVLDTRRSSLTPDASRRIYTSPLKLRAGEPLELTIFLDCSVVEIFANRRANLTGRIYPSRLDANGIGVIVSGGRSRINSIDIHEMLPISQDRLTT
jgi:beta-fructofuranosidase